MSVPKQRSPASVARARATRHRAVGIAATLAEMADLRQATLIDVAGDLRLGLDAGSDASDADADAWLADAGYDVRGEALAGLRTAPAPSLSALPRLSADAVPPGADARLYDPFAACEAAAEHLAGYFRRTLDAVELVGTTLGVYAAGAEVDWTRADVRRDLANLQARTREMRQRLGTWQRKINRAVVKAERVAAQVAAMNGTAEMEAGGDGIAPGTVAGDGASD